MDEPSDEIMVSSAGTVLLRMRPDLHGVFVWDIPEVRTEFEAKGYKAAKRGSGWVQNESAFRKVNDAQEIKYGDCVIMVVTLNAFQKEMARLDAKRKAELNDGGGELRLSTAPPPPADPD